MNPTQLLRTLQDSLQAEAVEKTRLWWQKYLKDVIPFRGVGIPQIRKTLGGWRDSTGLAEAPTEDQLDVALALFEQPIAEDKLAGILYLQIYLQDRLPWEQLLPRYATLYERELIFDWNTCDWFCVRVLGPTLKREGPRFAAALGEWSRAEYLWQARSAAVPFIKVVDERRYDGNLERICTRLIQRPERFAKTAVGWVLRDLSRHEPALVSRFVREQAQHFSLESARNATKYFEPESRAEHVAMVKEAARSGSSRLGP